VVKLVVIAVSGQVGAGKTTYAKKLAKDFNLRYVSNGELFRQLAKEHGVSLLEFHKMAEENPEYDKMVDERAIEEAKKGNVVIDGHLAAWVLSDIANIKILLIAPFEERVKRIAERDGKTLEEAKMEILTREESNKKRCKEYYGKDMNDWSIFNIIIDTSKLSIEGVHHILHEYVKTYITEHEKHK